MGYMATVRRYRVMEMSPIQFIYSCNKGLWPKVQIQVQVLTVSVIHDVQMLLINISHLHFCYSSNDKIVLKMVEYNIYVK